MTAGRFLARLLLRNSRDREGPAEQELEMIRVGLREIPGRPLDAEQLWKAVVVCGEVVAAAEVFPVIIHAEVTVVDDVIVMNGASGAHRLRIAASDPARLHAHWTGFKENAERAAAKLGIARNV